MLKRLTKAEFTNLDKILYPELKISKAQVIEYYVRIAPKMLDVLADRPVVMTRFPNGVDKEGFYEKDAPAGTPSWVRTFRKYSETARHELSYILCNNLDTLVWLANLAAIELHVTLSRADAFDVPEFVFFDIDPQSPAGIDEAVEVSLLLKEKLDSLNLRAYIKTTGKRGLHVLLPIVSRYTFRQTRQFVHVIGKYLAKESSTPVSDSSKTKVSGTVFIDYLQNSHGKTMICPYSLRATPQATVSTPLQWKEVKTGLQPEKRDIFSVVRTEENPWKGLLTDKQKLEVDKDGG